MYFFLLLNLRNKFTLVPIEKGTSSPCVCVLHLKEQKVNKSAEDNEVHTYSIYCVELKVSFHIRIGFLLFVVCATRRELRDSQLFFG